MLTVYSAHLSLMHPSLFEAIILVDPVIQRENPSRKYALPSTYRRDIWPSRKEAAEKFQSSAFYRAWDPRVLDKWVEYGLRDLPTMLHPTSGGMEESTKQPRCCCHINYTQSAGAFHFLAVILY